MSRLLRSVTLGAGVLLAVPMPATAQRAIEPVRATWETYPTKYYAGTTRAEQSALMATLGEIERILLKIPEIAHPSGFRITKNPQGGGPPWHPDRHLPGFDDPNSILQYSFALMFKLPGASEGSQCIEVRVNRAEIGDGATSQAVDEAGRIIIVEQKIGEPVIPGATILHGGLRWDTPDADRRSAYVVFSNRGVSPWTPVTREQWLRWWIYHAEGPDYGVDERLTRKKLEKTTYDRWVEEAAQRKKDRDDAIAIVVQAQGRAAGDEMRKTLEQTEREMTERLKAEDADERKRNQDALSVPSQADQFRARIAAMSASERASPAFAPYNSTEFAAPDDPDGRRVLTPDPEFWRVRRSRVEVKSITVAFHAHLTCGAPAVQAALEKAYQSLDWAAIKRIVDRPW